MNETRSPGSRWSRLCRSLCREQGAKDAVMVALMAIVLGALALQIGIGSVGPRPQRGSGGSERASLEPQAFTALAAAADLRSGLAAA